MVSDLLFGMGQPVFSSWVPNMVTLLPLLLYSNFSISSYQWSLSNFTRVSLVMYSRTHSCRCIYCSFENNGHADIVSSIASSCSWHSLHFLFVIALFCCIIFILVHLLSYCYNSTFSFCFQISPRYPKECVIFSNNLPIYTSNTLSTYYFLVLYAFFLGLVITLYYLFLLQHC
jgi:hypothetical protein